MVHVFLRCRTDRATATTAFDVALNVFGGVRDGTGAVETLRNSPPSVLRKLCERMGATYIKVQCSLHLARRMHFASMGSRAASFNFRYSVFLRIFVRAFGRACHNNDGLFATKK